MMISGLVLLLVGIALVGWAQLWVIRSAFSRGYRAGERHGYSVGFAKSARVVKIVPDAHCPKDAMFLLPIKETP